MLKVPASVTFHLIQQWTYGGVVAIQEGGSPEKSIAAGRRLLKMYQVLKTRKLN